MVLCAVCTHIISLNELLLKLCRAIFKCGYQGTRPFYLHVFASLLFHENPIKVDFLAIIVRDVLSRFLNRFSRFLVRLKRVF